MFTHLMLVPMLIFYVLILTMCILFDLCCDNQDCEVIVMLVLLLPCIFNLVLSMTLLKCLMKIQIIFMDPPHKIHITNVSTNPTHDNPNQVYVPTTSLAMVRRRSNRLNGVGLDVQYHAKYEMGILRKIVKILTRDLLELKNVNPSLCKLVHVDSVVLFRFWNVEDEVHKLIVQLFARG